ncbi:MAG TPA: carboxypeptidase regulatory-like domain-containing protein [Candidatus Limnocylindrales bacterium]|nr:carboxypeptidase regulatory-like domain-containing protein [Candidatus Limnocylindrales bacterium]
MPKATAVSSRVVVAALCSLGLLATKPASAQSVIAGTVVDSARRPIAGVELIVRNGAGGYAATTRTSANGSYVLPGIRPGAAYRLTARKLGYAASTIAVTPLTDHDTATFRFVLREAVGSVAGVTVTAARDRHPYSIDSLTIAGIGAVDALDALVHFPWMNGDGWRGCRPDTSRLMIGSGVDRSRPMPDTVSALSDHGEPFRLFVDGQPRAEQSLKNVLASIPADSIAEMNYVSCWDRERPYLRNSLSVVLKHAGGSRAAPATHVGPWLPRDVGARPAPMDTVSTLPDPTRSGVRGVVIDSLHGGRAFADALVTIEGGAGAGITDSTGRYRIDDVAPGSYRLIVSHPLLDSLGIVLTTPPVTLSAGLSAPATITVPPTQTLLARLCPDAPAGSAIVGGVVDAEGRHPIAGAEVTFSWTELQIGKDVGVKRVAITRTAATDASGYYRVCDIPGPVSGVLRVDASGRSLMTQPLDLAASQLVIGTLRVDPR